MQLLVFFRDAGKNNRIKLSDCKKLQVSLYKTSDELLKARNVFGKGFHVL